MTDKLPPKTHNRPPFDPETIIDLSTFADDVREAYQFKIGRRDEIVLAVDNWMKTHPDGIVDDEDQAQATDRVAQYLAEIDSVHGKPNSVHTIAKKPFLEGGRIVDKVLNAEIAEPLRTAAGKLQAAMKTYAIKKHQEAVARARQEEQRLAEEAAARAAALRPSSSQADMDAALEAEQAAMDAAGNAAPIKPASTSRTYGELGTSSGLRGTWKVRIDNPDVIPRAYLMPDMAMLEAKMQSSRGPKKGPPQNPPPGVSYYEDFSLAVRR